MRISLFKNLRNSYLEAVRFRSSLGPLAILVIFLFAPTALGASIKKVLPHLLDQRGRHTLYPSLFERDFYQAHLRTHPQECSGIRFDVEWKGRELKGRSSTLRLEVRGVNTPPRQSETYETKLPAGGIFTKWSSLRIEGKDFARLGHIRAWRVTIWDGDKQLAEQKSFLW